MNVHSLSARVEQGRLRWCDITLAAVTLSKLEGCDVVVTVTKPKTRRSLAQNRAWWGITIPVIAEHLGYDMHEHEMVHYALVAKCFGETRDEKLKRDVPNVRSSKLTTAQFSELMEWAVRFAASVERINRQESAKVKARSGGRCEVWVKQPFVVGTPNAIRCTRYAAPGNHHLQGGNGRRNRGASILAEHRLAVCSGCHLEITNHVLRPLGTQVVRESAATVTYERVGSQ